MSAPLSRIAKRRCGVGCSAVSKYYSDFFMVPSEWAVGFLCVKGISTLRRDVFCRECHFASSFMRAEWRISDRDPTGISSARFRLKTHICRGVRAAFSSVCRVQSARAPAHSTLR